MSSSNTALEEVESDPYQVAQTIALLALGRRAKSRGELATLLKKRGIDQEVATSVLKKLEEQGFVNDYEFARSWSESRQRTKKVSRRIIIGELRAKGISDEIIEWVTSDISDDDIGRRNTIVKLLVEWGLIEAIDPEEYKEPQLSLARLKIISHSEKKDWQLVPKYHIGK